MDTRWFDGVRDHARRRPTAPAVSHAGPAADGSLPDYTDLSFAELSEWSDVLARRFAESGIGRGDRTIVLINPGPELYAVLFALFKAGAIPVVIDPGMGVRPMLRCLSAVDPQAFVGIPQAHVLRVLFRRAFRGVRVPVTVGRRWFWGGRTLAEFGRGDAERVSHPTPDPRPVDPAAPAMIAFTTGSTGPAKAVELTHGNLAAMLDRTQALTGTTDRETALVTLPVFGVLYLLLGTRIVLPPLIPSRVGSTDPAHVVDAVTRFGVRTLFASPAVLAPLLAYCRDRAVELPTVRAVFSGGAPVPNTVIVGLREILPADAEVHAGYGATESIPMSSIESRELAAGPAQRTGEGVGTCIGRPAPGIEVRLLTITDDPVRTWDGMVQPADGLGEIVVSGPNVSSRYHWPDEANLLGKIADGDRVWHRTGDVGWIDEEDRIWFCGRKSQRVELGDRTLHTVQVEQVFNTVDGVARTALVGVGARPRQRPVLCIELEPGADAADVLARLRAHGADLELTAVIDTFLVHPGFPVDIRHNAKIGREQLSVWAGRRLDGRRSAGGRFERWHRR
ncbi:fatty acid CoA ligase family protein [Rhodococcus gannanensis]|uniref:Fatty acid CoA ligase family protein n=1 Tax=Rhodococcus gannanensis TaxID=1960308 RepID=A0ABW4P544_9NOCA